MFYLVFMCVNLVGAERIARAISAAAISAGHVKRTAGRLVRAVALRLRL